MKRSEDSLRDLWDNIKCTIIQIIGVPEEEEGKKGTEKVFEEITVENFPNVGKEIVKMAIIKKSTNNKCWRGCGEKGTLLHCWWECNLIQPLWRTVWRFLKKLKIELPGLPWWRSG